MADQGRIRWLGAALVVLLGLAPVATAETEGDWLAGQLLVATQKMADPRFAQTVIYMVRHDQSGALGLVVNKPVAEVPFADFLRGMRLDPTGADGSVRLRRGGPVQPNFGFVLHSADYVGEDTLVVDGSVAMTARDHVFQAMADGSGPERSLIVLGYSGWAPGQLEGEIERGSWFTVPADVDLVFDDDDASKWRRAVALRRIDL